MPFKRVQDILNKALDDWASLNGGRPNLTRHNSAGHPPFSWKSAAELRAAWGKGVALIQPEIVGNGRGAEANLVIDLKMGLNGAARMPDGGPYLTDAEIQDIVDWIDAGCPDDPAPATAPAVKSSA